MCLNLLHWILNLKFHSETWEMENLWGEMPLRIDEGFYRDNHESWSRKCESSDSEFPQFSFNFHPISTIQTKSHIPWHFFWTYNHRYPFNINPLNLSLGSTRQPSIHIAQLTRTIFSISQISIMTSNTRQFCWGWDDDEEVGSE